MITTGKLFGCIGQTAPAPAQMNGATAAIAASLAQKIAQSYEAQRRRRSATVIQLFQEAPRMLQMAA